MLAGSIDKVLPLERLLLGLARAFVKKKRKRQLSLFSQCILSCCFKSGVKKLTHTWTAYLGRPGRAGKNKSLWCFFSQVHLEVNNKGRMEGKGNTTTVRSLLQSHIQISSDFWWRFPVISPYQCFTGFYHYIVLTKQSFAKLKGDTEDKFLNHSKLLEGLFFSLLALHPLAGGRAIFKVQKYLQITEQGSSCWVFLWCVLPVP